MKRLCLAILLSIIACGPEPAIDANVELHDSLLQAPAMDLTTNAPPVFHPVFSAQNYEAVLKMTDLSYAVANEFGFTQNQPKPTQLEIGAIRARIQSISQWFLNEGFGPIENIPGKTGFNNVDDDITAIMTTNKARRMILIGFHGSRSGSKNPNGHDGHGDWGANFDSEPVAPSTVGIPELPDFVRIHRGFGRNLASARPLLLKLLDQHVQELGGTEPIWIWLTGHSKGGAMASLAAGLVKAHFASMGAQFDHVKVGGILFSSPRAWQGDQSQKWLHDTVGRANIFRINVHLDPVTVTPSRSTTGYRSVGVLFLDSIWAVNLRTRQNYGVGGVGWFNPDDWANYHYGCSGRGLGFEFDPNIVMRYSELAAGFEEGRLHLKERAPN